MPASKRAVQAASNTAQSAKAVYGSSIGIETEECLDVIRLLKKGLPVDAFDVLQRKIGVSAKTLASIVNIAPRTLSRRKQEGRFHTDESERLLRIAKLFDRACALFGDPDTARRWLKTPQRALGSVSPLDFADTEPGAQEVEDLMGRLEHGVFA